MLVRCKKRFMNIVNKFHQKTNNVMIDTANLFLSIGSHCTLYLNEVID